MQIDVEFIDQKKNLSNHKKHISLPAFLKHAALTGQGQNFGILPTISRGLGALMFYNRYLDYEILKFNGFRKSDLNLFDPTDQGAFSTIVGKAMADFLAKNMLQAKYTHSYESAMVLMGYPVVGPRPDLYCTTSSQQFAMEAKGFSTKSISPAEMIKHKAQSLSGPISVNFSVASVSYNIYTEPRCKFHDPVGDDAPFYANANETLARMYYSRILEELDNYTDFRIVMFNERYFRIYDLSQYFYFPKSTLPVNILIDDACTKKDNSVNFMNLNLQRIDEQFLYVDTDGIGIMIGPYEAIYETRGLVMHPQRKFY